MKSAPATIVRVRTEVAAVAKEFDYSVPTAWSQPVVVGTRVRVPLHGRSVRGWVVDDGVADPGARTVLALKSWLGWGPPSGVVELAEWAGWRWAGSPAAFLGTASPSTIVRGLPSVPVPPPPPAEAPVRRWSEALAAGPPVMVRLPPAIDLLDLVLSLADHPRVRARHGSLLVLVPSAGWAGRLCARLVRRGWPATTEWAEARAGWPIVVGSRAGAWAPVPAVAGVVVLDAHDAAYREESSPTYSAVDVVLERARRAGAPCVLASPVPPVTLAASGLTTVALPVSQERVGWPTLVRVDRRQADPRTGLFSEEFVRLAHAVLDDKSAGEESPLVCVYNRTGGARLLACAHCGEVARCERCGAAVARDRTSDILRCPRCEQTRPVVCAHCGRLRMKTLRAGVSRLRDELAALLAVDVGEVAGPKRGGVEDSGRPAPVLIGTEAVLHRVRRAAAVAFLDIDLHLLAPRLSATEDTLTLFVRAGRLVGVDGRAGRARVLAQTRVPDHPVLEAVALGQPAPVLEAEAEIRRMAGLPPFAALAVVSGALAPAYTAALQAAAGSGPVSVASLAEDRSLLRAESHVQLCDLLASVPRPAGRGLRVEVDPVSV